MGSAIKGITHLTLDVQCVQGINTRDAVLLNPYEQALIINSDSANINHVSRSMCAALAAALPSLQQLRLVGLCSEASLDAFGRNCLQLQKLVVEVCSVPAASLHGIHYALPNLSHLTLTLTLGESHIRIPRKKIQTYINAVVSHLVSCKNLKILHLDMNQPIFGASEKTMWKSEFVECQPELWNTICPSVEELRCNVRLHWLIASKIFMSRMRVLHLTNAPGMTLSAALERCPLLQRLTVTGCENVQMLLEEDDDDIFPDQHLQMVKARFLSGFELCCSHISFIGPSETIEELIAVMAPLQNTTHCVLDMAGAVHVTTCLKRFKQVFPSVEFLVLDDGSGWADIPLMDEGFLTPLAGSTHLQRIDVYFQLRFTHEGLVKFCMSLPALTELCCLPFQGMSHVSVMNELMLQGRQVTIVEMPEPDFMSEDESE